MSLADQLCGPTGVQVSVQQARGLRIKGKAGTNDAYAVMQVGKEKFQTSVAEKSVAPAWGEEAAFDLPPGGGGGGGGGGKERSTLRVHVLHRALVGPDKLLGQAVVNLPQLSEDKTRSKTEWFKLLDKSGKADKDRGEVLLDIRFMRNNMTSSMFDLSAGGKSRSRLGKFKDKVRGKKRDSDPVSHLPSFNQVLTESDEEGDCEAAAGSGEKKKPPKTKSLFSHKSNLQRNMSQSMTVLTAKTLTLSGSQSSVPKVDSSEGKKKFKFLIHKRSNSSDGKDSPSGHQKPGAAEQSNVCINGSHVYRDEPPARASRSGSNFSLTSSGHGSMEDVPESFPQSIDSLRATRQYSPWMEEEEEEEEDTKENVGQLGSEAEEKVGMEEMEREEVERVRRTELERLADEKTRQEEDERRTAEDNINREEEEKIRWEEEERMRQEEGERHSREQEEWERLEEKKRCIEEERVRKEEQRVLEERMKEEEMLRRQEERRLSEQESRQKADKETIRIEEESAHKQMRLEEKETLRRQEERLRRQEEEEEERLRRQEEEEERLRRQEEEEERLRRQEEEEELRRQEAEERVRLEKQEEERRVRLEKQEEERRVRRLEEEERLRRQEAEERVRLEKQEEERVRRLEEERARRLEEEVRRREEERARLEKEEEKVRRQAEEEQRVGILKDEECKLTEEKRMTEEEGRRLERDGLSEEEERIRRVVKIAEEERIRRDKAIEEETLKEKRKLEEKAKREKEEHGRLVEEKRRLEEEERRRLEAEEVRREEEERMRVEEERRREKEQKLAEEKRLLEEQERRIERARKQREEQEMIAQEESARKEKEEHERMLVEKMRQREQERRQIEEEKIKRKEEERIRRKTQEKEVLVKEAQMKNTKTKLKAAEKKPTVGHEVSSNNPFDENFSNNPFEEPPDSHAGPDGSTAMVPTVQQRVQFAASSVGSRPVSSDEKDPINTQRERRPAPQPPGRSHAGSRSRGEQDGSAHVDKKGKDVRTVSVLPQRSVQMIAPLSECHAEHKNTENSTQSRAAKETSEVAKHNKRTAPPIPRPASEGPPSGQKTHAAVSSLNPFEEDEDEAVSAAPRDPTASADAGSVQRPPAADHDAAPQTKIKSSKARAPPLPAATADASSGPGAGGGRAAGGTAVTVEPAPEAGSRVPLQEDAGGKKEAVTAPVASRRLQPVKPLNPLEQQPASVVQGVKDTGLKGPYSQLTQAELVSLVLKQEKQLSERDKTISELEQYIDNLLVRVIEEKPSILLSLNSLKRST
uniref:RAB11 family interacting protein 1 (class I) a n=1 Tax=Gasterosteus aculeatus aculeatus TaxID=481459 RepID=A0AAQ4NS11_GASAC